MRIVTQADVFDTIKQINGFNTKLFFTAKFQQKGL